MFIIRGISILFLIQYSTSDQCASINYCKCSSDQTMIQCANRDITDDVLFELNNRLPQSVVLLNLSSNSLTSIRSLTNLNSLQILDLSHNRIQYLPYDIASKFPRLVSLNVQNNSLKSIPKSFKKLSNNATVNLLNNRFKCSCHFLMFATKNFFNQIICQNNKQFNGNDYCVRRNSLEIQPNQSQIAFENEEFMLNCSSSSPHYWTLDKEFYPSTITSFSYSTIIIHHLQINHSGLWTCHSLNLNRSMSLTVLKSPSNNFCQSIQMNTSKGYFYWPLTLINRNIGKKCPFGPAAWMQNSSDLAQVWFTCSSNRQWINFDASQCAFQTNISRMLDYLSLSDTNVLLHLVKYLSTIDRTDVQLDDIVLLIDLIDDQQQKHRHQDEIILIYHLVDFILGIKNDFIYSKRYRVAIIRLKTIIEYLLDITDETWFYIGKEFAAVTVLSSPGLSTFCFVPNRSLLSIVCETNDPKHESMLLIMQLPPHSDELHEYSLFRIVVYRQSTLFLTDVSITNHNPLVYIRPVLRNMPFATTQVTFGNQIDPSSIEFWIANQTSWQLNSSICRKIQQNHATVTASCLLSNNASFSITYYNHFKRYVSIVIHQQYSQPIVYITSVIASICLFISILYCGCSHNKTSQVQKCSLHCLINYWLNLAVLLLLFAFGFQQYNYSLLCQSIAISAYYVCLTTILWLMLFTYSIWKKLYNITKTSDYYEAFSRHIISNNHNDDFPIFELESSTIVHFYLIAYGVSFLLVCINAVISHRQYAINHICFLDDFDSLVILTISLFVFIFLVLFLLLLARHYVKRLNNLIQPFQKLPVVTTKNKSDIGLKLKPTEIIPILSHPNENNEKVTSDNKYSGLCSFIIKCQHESINHLLSIIFQLILLVLLYLACLAIYIQPLQLRYEHMLYCYTYGFLILVLSCYTILYYVLVNTKFVRRFYFKIRKVDKLPNLSNVEPTSLYMESKTNLEDSDTPLLANRLSWYPSSLVFDSSSVFISGMPQNFESESTKDNTKTYSTVTSKYYLCQRDISTTKENNSESESQYDISPTSVLRKIFLGNQRKHKLFHQHILKRSITTPAVFHTRGNGDSQFPISPHTLPRSLTHSRTSISQAIVRLLPIFRLSSQNTNKTCSNSADVNTSSMNEDIFSSDESACYCVRPVSSLEEVDTTYTFLNTLDQVIQQLSSSDKLPIWKKVFDGYSELPYIDQDDDDCSVSLKSSATDSNMHSFILTNTYDQTQLYSSASSSLSSDFYNDSVRAKQIKLHESDV